MEDRKFSDDWCDLADAGEVPEAVKGTTAERAQRDAGRRRKRMPSEDRRAGRKIGPTLSAQTLKRLRAVCKALGCVGPDGRGEIVSSVVEDLLIVGLDAWEAGELGVADVPTATRKQLGRRR